jgi:hypothetical protein
MCYFDFSWILAFPSSDQQDNLLVNRNSLPVIVLFYGSLDDLRYKLEGTDFMSDFTGIPRYLNDGEVIFEFMKVPNLKQVPGVKLQLKGEYVVHMVINEEFPKIPPAKIAAVRLLTYQLGLKEPRIFQGFY